MPETAGGMLLAIDKKHAQEFSERLEKEFHVLNWIIGSIDNQNDPRRVRVSKNVEYVEITKI